MEWELYDEYSGWWCIRYVCIIEFYATNSYRLRKWIGQPSPRLSQIKFDGQYFPTLEAAKLAAEVIFG